MGRHVRIHKQTSSRGLVLHCYSQSHITLLCALGSATPRKSVRELKSYKDFEGFLGFSQRFLCTKAKISDIIWGRKNSGILRMHIGLLCACVVMYATMVVRDTFALKIPRRSALCSYSRLSVCCVSLSLHLPSPR